MSKGTCGQVLVLPSRRLVRPATDDDFVKLLYSLQNCFMPLKKNYFCCYHSFMEKSHAKLPKNEPKISHKLRLFVKGFKKSKIDF